MEITVYNPQKGRLETLDIKLSKANTSWLDDSSEQAGSVMMADIKEGVVVKQPDYSYPVLLYPPSEITAKDNPEKILQLLNEWM